MLKFLHLGDSYTCGESLPIESSWPWLLTGEFRKKEIPIQDPVLIAETGWTSSDLVKALDEVSLDLDFNIVSLSIGVNNQYQGFSLESYAQEFEALLSRAIQFAGGIPRNVFVVSIPDWSETPFAKDKNPTKISQEVKRFNRENARLTYLAGAQYINIAEISHHPHRDPSFLAEDQLHYTEKMYRRWTLEIMSRVWRTVFPDKNIHIPLLYQRKDLLESDHEQA